MPSPNLSSDSVVSCLGVFTCSVPSSDLPLLVPPLRLLNSLRSVLSRCVFSSTAAEAVAEVAAEPALSGASDILPGGCHSFVLFT